MATNKTYKKRLLLMKTALKVLISTPEFYHNSSVYMEQWLKYTLQFFVGRTELTVIFKGFHDQYPLYNMASLGCKPAAYKIIYFMMCQIRKIYCWRTLEEYFLPIANLKVIFYVFHYIFISFLWKPYSWAF